MLIIVIAGEISIFIRYFQSATIYFTVRTYAQVVYKKFTKRV